MFYECDSGSVGRAPPCQGGNRGFESRLSLFYLKKTSQNVRFLIFIYSSATSMSPLFNTFRPNNIHLLPEHRRRLVSTISTVINILSVKLFFLPRLPNNISFNHQKSQNLTKRIKHYVNIDVLYTILRNFIKPIFSLQAMKISAKLSNVSKASS